MIFLISILFYLIFVTFIYKRENRNKIKMHHQTSKIKELRLKHDNAIQFIKINEKRLEITQEGLDLLNEIQGLFAFCVCVGPYRQGKSFLMNRLLDTRSGFGIGHSDQACTKGAWIWKEPLRIEKEDHSELKLFFIDTEGLESDNNKWDTKLFLISFLLSSVFLYNTKNALNADAFKKISAISTLKKIIFKEDKKSKEDLPDFVWIVRDYSLASTVEPKERLNAFLKEEKFEEDENLSEEENFILKKEVKIRNQVKQNMKSSFGSLDCIYMPVPVSDGIDGMTFEEALQNLEKLGNKNLRSLFNSSLSKLKETIKEKAKAKKFHDVVLSGPMFAHMIKGFLDKINSESDIILDDVMSFSIKTLGESALEEAKSYYVQEMSTFVSPEQPPIKWQVFHDNEKEVENDCVEIIRDKIKSASNCLYKEYLERFTLFREVRTNNELTGGKLFEFRKMNEKNIFKFNERKSKQLWDELMKPRYTKESFSFESKEEFRNEIKNFKLKLEEELFELFDLDEFWSHFVMRVVNLEEIKEKVEEHFDRIERAKKEAELQAEREEKARIEAEKLRIEKEAIECRRKAEEEREQNVLEYQLKFAESQKESAQKLRIQKAIFEVEKTRLEMDARIDAEKKNDEILDLKRRLANSEAEKKNLELLSRIKVDNQQIDYYSGVLRPIESHQSNRVRTNRSADSVDSSLNDSFRSISPEYERDNRNRIPAIYASTPNSSSSSRSGRLVAKEDYRLTISGEPDRRYKGNRDDLVSSDGIKLKLDGTTDMRFKENKLRFGNKQF